MLLGDDFVVTTLEECVILMVDDALVLVLVDVIVLLFVVVRLFFLQKLFYFSICLFSNPD